MVTTAFKQKFFTLVCLPLRLQKSKNIVNNSCGPLILLWCFIQGHHLFSLYGKEQPKHSSKHLLFLFQQQHKGQVSDNRRCLFLRALPLQTLPQFPSFLISMSLIWMERWRKPQYCFLIPAASRTIVTLRYQFAAKRRRDAHYLRSLCFQQQHLCEDHGFRRFVTVQKWRDAHSKMSSVLQDCGFPEGRKKPSCFSFSFFGLGLDVALQVLVCLCFWGAGKFLLWWSVVTMNRMCLFLYDHCVMYITKLWKPISTPWGIMLDHQISLKKRLLLLV